MRVEQFRYTNNGRGYHKGKSPNVDQLLTTEDFACLIQRPLKKGVEWAITETWLDNIGVYARSYIRRFTDDLGRTGTVNHTFLISYKDLAKYAISNINLDDKFIRDDSITPQHLPTLEIGES